MVSLYHQYSSILHLPSGFSDPIIDSRELPLEDDPPSPPPSHSCSCKAGTAGKYLFIISIRYLVLELNKCYSFFEVLLVSQESMDWMVTMVFPGTTEVMEMTETILLIKEKNIVMIAPLMSYLHIFKLYLSNRSKIELSNYVQ